ncbi:ATP-dependent DNA helicase [Anaerolentibacter hominis]|uniref:ATP-dependent DNA helicase n=1 Tax=Anaerolentibacter hominis TaxID=3079009 RepID=UPI0031B834FA
MALTTSQINAVNTVDSNLQMVACAGSGKTTTMVARILNLLKQPNVKPENIVAVTYSKKAAASLKQKIYKEFEKEHGSLEGLADMYVGTIHGYCYYLLQNYNDDYKNYELLEEVQTRLFMKRFRSEIGIYDVLYHQKNGEPYPLAYQGMTNSKFQEAISAYKTFLDIAREYGVEKLDTSLQSHIAKYEECLDSRSKFDYTSIIVKTLTLLENGYFDHYITSTIKHLIVDEYQDVNDAQERIISYFYNKNVLVCVVGDDDQTIYHWRGSNLTYIRDFQKRYNNVKREDLDINFRSSQGITDVARQVIINNKNRLSKQMNSNNTQHYEKGDIIAYDFDERASEINFIVKKIKQLIGAEYTKDGKTYGLDYDDMVILVSSVKKIPELIQALQISGIDFIVEGTQKLFETDEVKTLCETFNVLFELIATYNKATFTKSSIQIDTALIKKWVKYSHLSDYDIKQALLEFVFFFHRVDDYEYTIQENLKNLFADLQLINQVQDEKTFYNLGKFTEIINDFEKIYLDMSPLYKLKAFQTFLRDDAPTIYPEGWLSPNFKTIRSLRIMTYHQSKGLEFPVVFLPFLTQNSIFPLRKPGGTSAWGIFNDSSIKNSYENDEESFRRLFYVGITRSEKFLFMTRSPQSYGNGTKLYKKSAQPFIEAKNSQYAYQDMCFDIVYSMSSEKKFSSDEVITLNFSLLKDLFDCPFKFEMLNVFGFHSPLNIRMGYGRSVHNMLDFVHKHYKEIERFDDTAIQNIVERYLYLPYGSKLLVDAMQKKAFQHLRSYIINNESNFPNILFSEKTIDYSISEYLFIDGRIDLVKDSLNNTITIVDFKSSSEVLSKEQIKNQLMVYVLGYENLTGDRVDFIESYDFNNNNPTRIPIVQSDKDSFKKKLENCHSIIRNATFDKIITTDSSKGKAYCQDIKCEFIKNCFPA